MEEQQLAHYERGRTLMQLNRPEAAINALRDALTGEAIDGYPLALIGQCQYLLEQLPAAEKSLEAAVELMPDYHYAHYLLGMTLLQTGEHDQALRHFDLALELEPENKFALLGKAKYYTVRRSYAEAEPYADAALSADPDFIDALQLKSVLLGQRGEGAEAARVAALALALNPENPMSLRAAGFASGVDGNRKAAEHFYGESLRTDPNPEAAYQYLEAKASNATYLVVSPLNNARRLFIGLLALVPLSLLSGWISSVWFDGFLMLACAAIIVAALVPFVHIAYTSKQSFGRMMVFKDWHQARNLLHFVGAVLCYGLYLYSVRDVFFSAALFFFVYGLMGLALEVLPAGKWKKVGYVFLGLAYVLGAVNFMLDFTSLGSVRRISQVLFVAPLAVVVIGGLFVNFTKKS